MFVLVNNGIRQMGNSPPLWRHLFALVYTILGGLMTYLQTSLFFLAKFNRISNKSFTWSDSKISKRLFFRRWVLCICHSFLWTRLSGTMGLRLSLPLFLAPMIYAGNVVYVLYVCVRFGLEFRDVEIIHNKACSDPMLLRALWGAQLLLCCTVACAFNRRVSCENRCKAWNHPLMSSWWGWTAGHPGTRNPP